MFRSKAFKKEKGIFTPELGITASSCEQGSCANHGLIRQSERGGQVDVDSYRDQLLVGRLLRGVVVADVQPRARG